MDKKVISYFQLAGAMTIVGSTVVVGKMITNQFPIFLSQELSLMIALPILIYLSIKMEGGLKVVGRRDMIFLFLQAFTGIYLFRVLLLCGLKYTSASESGIITSTTPVVLAVISFIFLREKVTRNKAVGIIIVLLGILIINIFGGMTEIERGSNPVLGNLLVFSAVICEALFTIFRKLVSKRITPIVCSTYVVMFGILIFFPFSLYEAKGFEFFKYSIFEYMPIIYYGIFGTVLAYILWFKGVRYVEASTVAVYTGVMPISSVCLSYIILQEAFSWIHIIGILIVISGVLFISVQKDHTKSYI